MPAEILLNELHKVRKSGTNKWMACCPAHDDKSPSLSISEASGGHILIHCFAGCETSEILAIAGLSMADLFPERDARYFDDRPPEPPPRQNRIEEEKANIEFRLMIFERQVGYGHRFSSEENKKIMQDYQRFREIKQILASRAA